MPGSVRRLWSPTWANRAEELGFAVAVGHCLDIEAGVSFGPVIEAVATLLAGIEDVGSRPLARRLRAFLDPAAPSSAEQRNLLEDLRLVILEAAGSGPVLLVLEDLHWADASTRDLAVALSRPARGRLMFVLSVRIDDLHRRHPARKALAEIGRATGGRRVELGPLDRASIAGIVAPFSGTSPDPALVRSVLERSEGNPLYAEEIVAAWPGAVPDQLSWVLRPRESTSPAVRHFRSDRCPAASLEAFVETLSCSRPPLSCPTRASRSGSNCGSPWPSPATHAACQRDATCRPRPSSPPRQRPTSRC
jgi:AAA ATPase domain